MIRALAAWFLSVGLALAEAPTADEMALVNAEFALRQQAAIVLAQQHRATASDADATLSVLGRIADGEDATAVERMLTVAEAWLLMAEGDGLPRFLTGAGVSPDTARLVLCYVAGEGPGRAHRLIARWGAPRKADGCEARFADRLDAAAEAYRGFSPGGRQSVAFRYGTDRWSRFAAVHNLLETVAGDLSADFTWPDGLRLEIVPCGGAGVRYRPDPPTVTLCAETIGRYHALAKGRTGD